MISWSLVFAIGAGQAALLALALWRRPINPQANRMLAGWVALIGADLAVKAVYFHGPAPELLKAYRLVSLLPFLYGSLFYLYARALTEARGLDRRDLVHLSGFVVALLANTGLFLQDAAQDRAFFEALRHGAHWPGRPWLDILLFGYSLSYVIAGLVRVRRYRRGLLQRRSDADRMSLHWIDAMAVSQIVIWCIALVQWLARIPWIDYPLIYGAVVGWVFVVGYLSLHQVAVAAEPEPEPAADAKLEPAGVDDPRFPAVEARLLQLMAQEQLYREPALTIGQLAKRSGYPEYLVSDVINRRFEGHFWDYINRQRVEAARVCLADAGDTRTILDIAYACGYTSKSTFNAAFKRQLAQTPSAYRQRHAGAASTRDVD
ncbi:AraC family transcriptional regulator [Lysobacter sp. Root667]|uniref:helix-turn-helix domain-containing protein n=1 Tax=Lysobacter sp. Root667 TaxID=1736581 RepID=UPI0006F38B8D|nr:helix-turn-helix transcriptional regulator [Lysobacter sp. Root667]KRA82050.1 AraC family transcriptional regulator [Lysobacter sp. Root667]